MSPGVLAPRWVAPRDPGCRMRDARLLVALPQSPPLPLSASRAAPRLGILCLVARPRKECVLPGGFGAPLSKTPIGAYS
eukprot:7693594-Alexandrium_andersonii.AAC.1